MKLLMIQSTRRNRSRTTAVALCALFALPLPVSLAQQPTSNVAAPATQPAHLRSSAELRVEASQLINQAKYEQAIANLDAILQRDSANEFAASLRRLVNDQVSQLGASGYSGDKTDQDRDLSARATAMLDRTLPLLDFEDKPFGEVVDFLRDASNSKISVNWNTLNTAGIHARSPVTLKLRNVKASKALVLILNNVGGRKARLDYAVQSGTIVITLEEELTPRTVRIYDIRRLLFGLDEPTAAARQAAIINLIDQTIDPRSWKSRGGATGDIQPVSGPPGTLLITQTIENQAAIGQLLEQLREQNQGR